jgi:pilus assembly protein Flp/PilA
MKYPYEEHESGQGLVEYALVLTLVAVVVIGILTFLGPMVANVYANIGETLDGGPITQISVVRDRGQSHHAVVSVTVSQETQVTFELAGQSKTKTCTDTCEHVFNKAPDGTGQITIKAGDDEALLILPPG